MIRRGLFILTILSNCVLSLPVTSSQLENEDVKVMKCIVEALAEVLSKPHSVPVSQECLVTLKTDDRLVTILRHHNFLKELQEIAVEGGQQKAQLQRDARTHDPTAPTPQTADAAPDRSMMVALGGPGERSILSQKRTENVDEENENDERRRDGDPHEDNDGVEEVQVKREDDEKPGSQVSESVDEWSEGKADKREKEEEDEYEEKKANSEKNSAEENMTSEKEAGSDEKKDTTRNELRKKKFHEEDEEETEKGTALSSSKQEEEEERKIKRGSRDRLKQWTKRAKSTQVKKQAGTKETHELAHHSKEFTEEEPKEEKKDALRSPEEKELQMIARRAPDERRVSEEEGSASRKSEEPEIESLAAIESELENVAQKLHELRRG